MLKEGTVEEKAKKAGGAAGALKRAGLPVLILVALSVPPVASGLLSSYKSAKNGCRQTEEGACCAAEQKGEAIVVYFDGGMQSGRYKVTTKKAGERLEYCYSMADMEAGK